MRKFLSIALAILILCSSFAPNMAAMADQTEATDLNALNLLENGDFSHASNLDTTTKNYKGAAEGYGKWININTGILNFAYSADEGVGGSGALKATVPSTKYVRSFGQVLNVEDNTDYVISFKTKGSVNLVSGADSLYAGAFSPSGHAIKGNAINSSSYTSFSPSAEWTEYTIKFNTGTKKTIAVAFGGMSTATAGSYYLIDDVCLYKADTVAHLNAVATEGGSVTGGGFYLPNTKTALTATANFGYTFDGWYSGDEKLSDQTTISLVATNVTYTAKFNKSEGELLFDGGFDATSSIASAESYDTVTYESAHIWYKPSSNSTIEADGENTVLRLASWVYQSIKISENTTYLFKFKAKGASQDLNIKIYLRNLKNRGQNLLIIDSSTISAGEDWTEYTVLVEVNDLLENVTDYTLGLHAGDGNSVFLDDISFKKVQSYAVTATATAGGTATVDKQLANEGDLVTFTATPKKNFKFVGWFRDGEDVALSTDAVYSSTITGNLSITAKFIYDGVTDPDELLFDGGFDLTDSVALAESYDTVTYDSAHIWYKAPSNTTIEADGENTVLRLASWVHQSVKISEDTAYLLKFKAKGASQDLNIKVYLRNLKNRTQNLLITDSPTISAGEDWTEYTVLVAVNDLLENVTDYTLGLHAGDGNSVFLDDISFKKLIGDLFTAEVSALRGGTASVDFNVATPGSQITFTAVPDEGSEFLGWYLNGKTSEGPISTDKVFKTTITQNVKLIAVFGGGKYPDNTYNWINGDAELGTTEGWLNHSVKNSLSVITDNPKDGEYCFELKKEGEGTASRPVMLTEHGILLKGCHKYTISCNLRTYHTTLRPFLSTSTTYLEGKTDFVYKSGAFQIRPEIEVLHTVSTVKPEPRYYSSIIVDHTSKFENENGWINYSMSFDVPAEYDGTIVYFGLQCREGVGTGMLDNLTVTEEEINYDTQKSDKLYGDELYNLLQGGSFEEEAEGNFTNLPLDFTVAATDSPHGEKHLNVAANSGAYVIEINLLKGQWYYLSYFAKADKKGDSYLGVTFIKPNGNEDFTNTEALGITAFSPTASGKWYRDGFKFFSQSYEKAYIIIYGGDNAVKLDDLSLYYEKTAAAQNPNNPTLLPEYDYDGDGILYDKYDLMYGNAPVTGQDTTAPGTEDTSSPSTGDTAPYLLALALALSSTAVILLTKSKRRVK